MKKYTSILIVVFFLIWGINTAHSIEESIITLKSDDNYYSLIVDDTASRAGGFFESPNGWVSSAYITENNQHIDATDEIKSRLVAMLNSAYYSPPEASLVLAPYWDSTRQIYRPECGFFLFSASCGYALIGLDQNDRKNIYKKLIEEIIFNISLPALRATQPAMNDDGTYAFVDGAPKSLNGISEFVHNSNDVVDGLSTLQGFFALIESSSLDQYLSQLQLSSTEVEVFKNTAKIAQIALISGKIQMSFAKRIIVHEYMSVYGNAANRLKALRNAYEYVLNFGPNQYGQIDPAFLNAISEIETDLITSSTDVQTVLTQSLGSLRDNASDLTNLLIGVGSYVKGAHEANSVLKKYSDIFTAKTAQNLRSSIKNDWSNVGGVITGYADLGFLVTGKQDLWRTIFLSSHLHRVFEYYSFKYRNELSTIELQPDGSAVYIWDAEKIARKDANVNAIRTLTGIYYNSALSLVDQDWIGLSLSLSTSFLKGTVNGSLATPFPWFGSAVKVGDEAAKLTSNLVYSDEIKKGKADIEAFHESSITYTKALSEWYKIIQQSKVPPPPPPLIVNKEGGVVNRPPVAVITGIPERTEIGQEIFFNGSPSHDPDGDNIVSYNWTLIKPPSSTSSLSLSSNTSGSFRIDVAGSYTVTLQVSDSTEQGGPASSTITAVSPPTTVEFVYENSRAHIYIYDLSIDSCKEKVIGSFTVPPNEKWTKISFAASRGDVLLVARKNSMPSLRSGTCGAWEYRGEQYDWYQGTQIYDWKGGHLVSGDTLYLIATSYDGVSQFSINTEVIVQVDLDNDGVADSLEDSACLNNSYDAYDSDGDGVCNSADSFSNDPSASIDSDGDGYPDNWNDGYTAINSKTGLFLDIFPSDTNEWIDTDNDGVGDNSDAFPFDETKKADSDGDFVADSIDSFPLDRAASIDSDGDGYPDNWNDGYSIADSLMGLKLDIFPYDISEWLDSDLDGVGDNSDEFPLDPLEQVNSDEDAVGDYADAAPFNSERWSNTPPVSTMNGQSLILSSSTSILIDASDEDGDALFYNLISPPNFASLIDNRLYLDHSSAEEGDHIILIRVNDDFKGETYIRFNVTISAPVLLTDTDEDGIQDSEDNCTLQKNPLQQDTDKDGFGNICDADLNNDGSVNFLDLGLFKAVFATSDPDADFNSDGSVNFLDLGLFKKMFTKPPGPAGELNNQPI